MKKKYILKTLLKDFHAATLPTIITREYHIPTNSGKIMTLIGARRSGKSFLLYQLVKQITVQVPKQQIIFINFEDERLELQSQELDLVIQAYLELYPQYQDLSQCYFFFDEIQNITGWEKFIRRIYDTISKNIFITGSNAKMLSSEIATALRGRSLSYTIYPLSFKESLRFQSINPDIETTTGRALLYPALERYLHEGGFPELALLPNQDLKRKTLQEYYQVMLFRDMVERYHITNLTALKFFLKRLYASTTKQISINRIYNELKSVGIRIGKNALYDFLEQAESIFMIGCLKKYAYKISTQELSEKKVYAIDNGLTNAMSFHFSADLGKALEQMVFWELKRRLSDLDTLFYYKNQFECDFIIQREEAIIAAIQVCYQLDDPKTKQREIKGLRQTCQTFKSVPGFIITYDNEEPIEGIQVISVLEFLLSDCLPWEFG
ncbi:MAG: ATP-binding protein [Candidatus Parabeggiatoa sp.]|nr:ATP-binding protein [Candidatus Parabeggiatoa sp.]